jgi:hypothetical protein
LTAVTHEILSAIPSNSPSQQEALTSDELLPILAYVIIKSQIPYLTAEFEFMSHLQIRETEHLEYGYSLVSFQAAVQFLLHENQSVEIVVPPTTPKTPVTPLLNEEVPENYVLKSPRRGLSPEGSVEEIIERRKSLSFDVIKSFSNRIKDEEEFVPMTYTKLAQVKAKKSSPNPQLGDLLSSILDSD